MIIELHYNGLITYMTIGGGFDEAVAFVKDYNESARAKSLPFRAILA